VNEKCPSCGAEIGSASESGQQVCPACFHIWQGATQDLRPRFIYQPSRSLSIPEQPPQPGLGAQEASGDMAPGFAGGGLAGEKTGLEAPGKLVEMSQRAALGAPTSSRGGLHDADLAVIGQYRLEVPMREEGVWKAAAPSPDPDPGFDAGTVERTLSDLDDLLAVGRESTLGDLDSLLWANPAAKPVERPGQVLQATLDEPKGGTWTPEVTARVAAPQPTAGMPAATEEASDGTADHQFFAALERMRELSRIGIPALDRTNPSFVAPENTQEVEVPALPAAHSVPESKGPKALWIAPGDASPAFAAPAPGPPASEPTHLGGLHPDTPYVREPTHLDDPEQFFAALDHGVVEFSQAGIPTRAKPPPPTAPAATQRPAPVLAHPTFADLPHPDPVAAERAHLAPPAGAWSQWDQEPDPFAAGSPHGPAFEEAGEAGDSPPPEGSGEEDTIRSYERRSAFPPTAVPSTGRQAGPDSTLRPHAWGAARDPSAAGTEDRDSELKPFGLYPTQPAGSRAAPPQASQEDIGPFALGPSRTVDPFAHEDPAGLDPFAVQGPPTVDPFLSVQSQTAYPFASSGPPALDPFAPTAGPPRLDPFGSRDLVTLDPFASQAAPSTAAPGGRVDSVFPSGPKSSDPYRSGPVAVSDPFASIGAPVADPFASSAAPAGGTAGDDPFGWTPYQSQAEFGSPNFQSPDGDPPRAGGGGSAPRQTQAQPDRMQAGAAPSGPSKGAVSASGGAAFELDMPDAPASAAPSLGRKTGQRPRARTRRAVPRGGLSKKQRWMLPLAAVGVAVLAGAGLGVLTDWSYFGLLAEPPKTEPAEKRPHLGQAEKVDPAVKPATTAVVTKEPELLEPDIAKAYMDRVEQLKNKLKAQPRDIPAQQALARTLQRLRERYPAVFNEDPAYAKSLDEMLQKPAVADDSLVKVRTLLAEGKDDEAISLLEPRIRSGEAGTEEVYLRARAAIAKQDREAAKTLLERAIEQVPDYQAALYDLADLHRTTGRRAEAKAKLESLTSKNPNHAMGLLALAKMAQEAGETEAAARHVQSAISAAQAGTNRETEFQGHLLVAAIRTDPARQLVALERALELKPRHEATALEVAERLQKQGRHDEALKALKRCQDAGCASPEFFVVLVGALRKTDRAENAKTQLAEAVRAHPTHTGLLMLQVDMEVEAKRLVVAKEICQRVIDHDPKHVPAYLKLGELLANESQLDLAMSTLRDGMLHTEPADRLPLLQRSAEILITQGKTVEAKEVLERILSIDDNQIATKLRFAALLKQLGYLDDALKLYLELERDQGLDVDGHVKYAQVLHDLGQFDDALAKVQEVFFKDPLNEEANVLRGFVYTSRGEYAAAHNDFQRARKVNEESAAAHWGLGLNELAQNHLQEAAEYLTRAVELAPKKLDMRYDLARTLSRLGNPENRKDAIKQLGLVIREYDKFQTTLEKKQKRPEVYLQRGIEYLFLASFHKGLADIQEAERLAPERIDVKVAMGEALYRTKSFPEAEEVLKSALARDAYDGGANYFMGLVLTQTDREIQAVEHFRRAIAADAKRFPDAHRLLGYLYRDRGANGDSCKALSGFLENTSPEDPHRAEVQQLRRKVCGRRVDR
jgi:superkiller protein 3